MVQVLAGGWNNERTSKQRRQEGSADATKPEQTGGIKRYCLQDPQSSSMYRVSPEGLPQGQVEDQFGNEKKEKVTVGTPDRLTQRQRQPIWSA